MQPEDTRKVDRAEVASSGRTSQFKWGLVILAIFMAVGIILLGFAGAYAVSQGRSVNMRLCESSINERQALRELLIFIRDRAIRRASSEREVEFVTTEYGLILAKVPALTCTEDGVVKPLEAKPSNERRARG